MMEQPTTQAKEGAALSGGVIGALVGLGLLVVFMLQNTEDVPVKFLFWISRGRCGWSCWRPHWSVRRCGSCWASCVGIAGARSAATIVAIDRRRSAHRPGDGERDAVRRQVGERRGDEAARAEAEPDEHDARRRWWRRTSRRHRRSARARRAPLAPRRATPAARARGRTAALRRRSVRRNDVTSMSNPCSTPRKTSSSIRTVPMGMTTRLRRSIRPAEMSVPLSPSAPDTPRMTMTAAGEREGASPRAQAAAGVDRRNPSSAARGRPARR